MLNTVCQSPGCSNPLAGKQRSYCCNACKQRAQREGKKQSGDKISVTVIRSACTNIVIVGEKPIPTTTEVALKIGMAIVSNPNA